MNGHRLQFVDDSSPGITRRKHGKSWRYLAASGEPITATDEIDRLNAIGMPPAYKKCWFCPERRGHLQATGYDDRGRKQYRYHADFRAAREAGKFDLCVAFGEALPAIRAKVADDLHSRKVDRERAIAAVVRLLDSNLVRVGNDRYAIENHSYGATTLENRHVELSSRVLRLSYRAKSGRERKAEVRDADLVRFVRQMQDLPGQRLFRYFDEDGRGHDIGSADVNAYLHEHMGEAFTAKHFRTWGGSVTAFDALAHADHDLSLKEMVAPVAERLTNTPAMSRKSYIHPQLISLCKGDQAKWRETLKLPRVTRWLTREERGLIEFLSD